MTELEQLPARIDSLTSQVVQLRVDMAAGFSAVRADIQHFGASLRQDIQAIDAGLRHEIQALEAGLRREIEESRVHTRVLFEEYVGRFKTINEASASARKRRSKKRQG